MNKRMRNRWKRAECDEPYGCFTKYARYVPGEFVCEIKAGKVSLTGVRGKTANESRRNAQDIIEAMQEKAIMEDYKSASNRYYGNCKKAEKARKQKEEKHDEN